jgi:hypothetical protein
VTPLADLLCGVARGEHVPADGGWHRVPQWRPDVEAVIALTGHAVLAVGDDVSDESLERLGVDGYGGACAPRVLTALAGRDGWIDSLDVLLAAHPPHARSAGDLVPRPDLAEHPRVQFARAIRTDVQVFGSVDPSCRDLVTISRGIAGLPELSFEIEPTRRGRTEARTLLRSALDVVAGTDMVLAASAPGNAASLRALLGAGFRPLGSVQLLRPARPSRDAQTEPQRCGGEHKKQRHGEQPE